MESIPRSHKYNSILVVEVDVKNMPPEHVSSFLRSFKEKSIYDVKSYLEDDGVFLILRAVRNKEELKIKSIPILRG